MMDEVEKARELAEWIGSPLPEASSGDPEAYRTVLSSAKQDWMTPPDFVWGLERFNGEPYGWDATATYKANKACGEWSYFGPDQKDERLRDALAVDWLRYIPRSARTWMNPPYGYTIGKFTAKATDAFERGIAGDILIYDRTGTKWFRALKNSPATRQLIFLEGRMIFWDPDTGKPRLDRDGTPQTATAASVVFRMGPGRRPVGSSLEILWEAPWEVPDTNVWIVRGST